MAEPQPGAELYLHALAGRLAGSRRTRARLLTELRDHLDDAVAANLAAGMPAEEAEQRAVELLGPPGPLARAWEARCARLRARRRRRSALLIATAATAALLAAAQHADGRREPGPPARGCAAAAPAAAAQRCAAAAGHGDPAG
jgi:hypothetical protein